MRILQAMGQRNSHLWAWLTRRWFDICYRLPGYVYLRGLFMAHPFLEPIEVAMLRYLAKSPRVGLIAVKQHGSAVTWVVSNESDPLPAVVTSHDISEDDYDDDYEPPSSLFERLYHAPDAER